MVRIFVKVSEFGPFLDFLLLRFGESLLSLFSHLPLSYYTNFVILLYSIYQAAFYRLIFLYSTIHLELLKIPTKAVFFYALYFLLGNLIHTHGC